MNDCQPQINEWLREEGAQSPLLIVGQNESLLDELVEEVIRGSVQDRTTVMSDVERLLVDKSIISIKQVRVLIKNIRLKPLHKRRIFYIQQAHRLNQVAASALLKTLEDAPDYARYILTTSWPGRMLTTIRSRCVQVRIGQPLTQQTVNEQPTKAAGAGGGTTKAEEVTEDGLVAIGEDLLNKLVKDGPSRELRLSVARLVDYYRIKEKGGNEKMAKEVLLAHLMQGKS